MNPPPSGKNRSNRKEGENRMNTRPRSRTVVIIPALEPPETFLAYAADVAQKADRLIVINDGSGVAYQPTFDAVAALPRTHLISYDKNRGKGYALKQAFAYCQEHFAPDDILITADCDGQHKIADIFAVRDAVEKSPAAMVIGTRDFDAPNVPPRSRAGNLQMRRMIRALYGIHIGDTQSGLRGFTVATAGRLAGVRGNRFEFETGVLIYASHHKIPLVEVPIATVYPEHKEEHVSHFRTFSDSVRVMWALLQSILTFALSGAVAGVLDIGVFALFTYVIFRGNESLTTTFWATVIARVCSSLVNFTINRATVFRSGGASSIVRYYMLWGVQLLASNGLLDLFWYVLGLPKIPVKIVADLFLALCSYQIQRVWVFRPSDKAKVRHRGALASFVLFVGRVFSRRYRFELPEGDEPTVYVCRHLNMHGPCTTLKWFPKPVRPWVLSVFFNDKECYHQFADYTFSHDRKKVGFFTRLRARFASFFVVRTVRSLEAIPVYRHSRQARITLQSALACLLAGESTIIYPDIEYDKGYEIRSAVYTGFLYLSAMYRDATGKDLRFVPLLIDDKTRVVRGEALYFRQGSGTVREAAEIITSAINVLPAPVTSGISTPLPTPSDTTEGAD